MVRARRPRDHLLALHAQPRGRACSASAPQGSPRSRTGSTRPTSSRSLADLAQLRARYAEPDERLVLLVGRLVYEKGFHLALDALAPVIRSSAACGSWSPAPAPPRPSCAARRGGWASPQGRLPGLGRRRHAALALPRRPTSASSPRSMSRSGWSRSRRWRRAACAWSPTPAACARSCPATARSACAFPRATPRRSSAILERVLTDDAARAQLVAEAREHVLRFDWAEVARQTLAVYGSLTGSGAGRQQSLNAEGPAALPGPRRNSGAGGSYIIPDMSGIPPPPPCHRHPSPAPRRRSPRW